MEYGPGVPPLSRDEVEARLSVAVALSRKAQTRCNVWAFHRLLCIEVAKIEYYSTVNGFKGVPSYEFTEWHMRASEHHSMSSMTHGDRGIGVKGEEFSAAFSALWQALEQRYA